jgi:hypothetical protein
LRLDRHLSCPAMQLAAVGIERAIFEQVAQCPGPMGCRNATTLAHGRSGKNRDKLGDKSACSQSALSRLVAS